MEELVVSAMKNLEKQVEDECQRLDELDTDDLEKLREIRIAEMKKKAQSKQEWVANGHGEYTTLSDEKEFFATTKKSKDMICHFYKDSTPRCKIVDMHLKILAHKHLEAKFVRLDVERAPFLTDRLKVRVIPTIGLIKDSKAVDYIVGFTDLGNCDDFSTEMLEWRIAQSNAIEYNGDLCTPPDKSKKPKQTFARKNKVIRDGDSSEDSDDD